MIKEGFESLLAQEGDNRAFQYKGYACQIKRVHPEFSGHLCGYVEIPPTHYLYKMEYEDVEKKYDYELPAHGGLTFSGKIGDKFCIGFDCAHLGDKNPCVHPSLADNPLFSYLQFDEGETYKDMNYVRNNLKEIIDYIESH